MTANGKKSKAAPAPATTLFLFGAHGDLVKRLLMPALYNLSRDGLLGDGLRIVGVDHNAISDADFAKKLEDFIRTEAASKVKGNADNALDPQLWAQLAKGISYVQGDFLDDSTYQALAAKIASLEQLMSHLFEPIAEQDTQIEKSLVDLVQHITRQVIRRELAIDSSQIEHVMRDALKLLPLGVGNVRLYINPQDFEQVKALRERHEETWRIVEDASLQPGGCRVETEHSRIDATVETRISQIMAKLLDQAHEQVLNPAEPDLSVDLDAPDAP